MTSSVITPKPDYSKRKNWVPTRPEDLRNVTDPVTALIVPAAADPCRAMVGVFDGEARMNLRLAPKRTDKFSATGYNGDVTVCSIRYEPVSGHRRKSKDIDYIKRLDNIEIWFAKSAKLDVYAPVYLAVPTKYGVISITARVSKDSGRFRGPFSMTRATLIGFSAILMWSLLALMTAASGKMPPFQMNAVCFAIGALPGLILFAVKPERMKLLRQPRRCGFSALSACSAITFSISPRCASAGRRRQHDRLSLAAVHRARLGHAAG